MRRMHASGPNGSAQAEATGTASVAASGLISGTASVAGSGPDAPSATGATAAPGATSISAAGATPVDDRVPPPPIGEGMSAEHSVEQVDHVPAFGSRARSARGVVPSTRTSAVWTAVVAGLVFLTVVLVFILQNLQDVDVRFFTARWRIPLGLDLLLAAVLGGLVVVMAGAVRLLQLRRVARRHLRAHRGG